MRFLGDKIVSTIPFLEALATQSFIAYTLHAQASKHVCARIEKYCNRGFDLLQPVGFDGDFDSLMMQDDIPLYRTEYQEYIDDDGETCFATTEFRRSYAYNTDTFRLQEKFIQRVFPQLLQYQ